MERSGSDSEGLDAELRRALRAGAPVDIPALARRYRLSETEVRDCLAAVRALGRILDGDGAEATPTRLGRYQVLGELGRGGMGRVLRARDPELGRDVAIKMLPEGRGTPSQLRRFRDEARAMARARHPNIVAVHELGEDQGRPFIVMDLIEGEPLAALLLREGALPPPRAAAVIRDLARGLAHVHALGVLHRDIKPQNILLTREGRPMLGDFGLARLDGARTSASAKGAFLGTYGYAAPEQVLGGEVGEPADIYALGVILYRCLTGAHPFAHRLSTDEPVTALTYMEAIGDGRPRPLAGVRAELGEDGALEAICQRCLAGEARGRYPDAAALADDLDRALRGEPPSPARAPRPGLWVFALGLALGLILGAAAVLLAWRGL